MSTPDRLFDSVHTRGGGSRRAVVLLMLVGLFGVSQAGHVITRFSPVLVEPGISAYEFPPMYRGFVRAEVGSAAIGYAFSDNAGLAVGVKLTEGYILPRVLLSCPIPYLYFVSHVPSSVSSGGPPTFTVFAGLGLPYPLVVDGDFHPIARLGCGVEKRFGPITPEAKVVFSGDYYGSSISLAVGVGLWGWRSHGGNSIVLGSNADATLSRSGSREQGRE